MEIGWSELLVIGVVALVVIGPKDLPEMFRTLGRFTAKLRAMSREFSRAMEDAARESGVNDVANDLRKVASPKTMGLDAVKSAADKFEKWDPLKAPRAALKEATDPVTTAAADAAGTNVTTAAASAVAAAATTTTAASALTPAPTAAEPLAPPAPSVVAAAAELAASVPEPTAAQTAAQPAVKRAGRTRSSARGAAEASAEASVTVAKDPLSAPKDPA